MSSLTPGPKSADSSTSNLKYLLEQKNEMLKSLESDNTEYEELTDALSEELSNLRVQLQGKSMMVEETKSENEKLQSIAATLEAREEARKGEVLVLHEKIVELELQVTQLSAALEEQKKSNDSLQNELLDRQSALSTSVSTLTSQDTIVTDLRTKLQQHETAIADLVSSLSSFSIRHALPSPSALSPVPSAKSILDKASDLILSNAKTIARLQQEMEDSQHAQEVQSIDLQQKDLEIRKLLNELTNRNEEVAGLAKRSQELSDLLAKAAKEREDKIRELQEKNKTVSQLTTDRDEARASNEALMSDLSAARSSLRDAALEITTLKEACETAARSNQNLSSQVLTLSERVKYHDKFVEELQKLRVAAETKSEALQLELENLRMTLSKKETSEVAMKTAQESLSKLQVEHSELEKEVESQRKVLQQREKRMLEESECRKFLKEKDEMVAELKRLQAAAEQALTQSDVLQKELKKREDQLATMQNTLMKARTKEIQLTKKLDALQSSGTSDARSEHSTDPALSGLSPAAVFPKPLSRELLEKNLKLHKDALERCEREKLELEKEKKEISKRMEQMSLLVGEYEKELKALDSLHAAHDQAEKELEAVRAVNVQLAQEKEEIANLASVKLQEKGDLEAAFRDSLTQIGSSLTACLARISELLMNAQMPLPSIPDPMSSAQPDLSALNLHVFSCLRSLEQSASTSLPTISTLLQESSDKISSLETQIFEKSELFSQLQEAHESSLKELISTQQQVITLNKMAEGLQSVSGVVDGDLRKTCDVQQPPTAADSQAIISSLENQVQNLLEERESLKQDIKELRESFEHEIAILAASTNTSLAESSMNQTSMNPDVFCMNPPSCAQNLQEGNASLLEQIAKLQAEKDQLSEQLRNTKILTAENIRKREVILCELERLMNENSRLKQELRKLSSPTKIFMKNEQITALANCEDL